MADKDVKDISGNRIDVLGENYSREIRPFIDVIDNLRRFGVQQDIGLPNVVVVGDQSSGKSSIIEAISGIQLPRGKGIVTRCPLELQLIRVVDKPWKGTLSYKKLNKESEKIDINNPNEVEQYIRDAQDKMCDLTKGVSEELITLRIESPSETAPDLTLIDLPGIARIAVEGQPSNICEQIRYIIEDQIKNENTVILCVISANLDAAVNESINFSQTVDPRGKRTFGVITKPDMADEASKEDVLCLLNNEKIRLEKGFHMVKCRSQKDLDEGLSLEKSIENEKQFFETDRYYRTANTSQLGIFNLASRITEELVKVIRENLPKLRDKITAKLYSSQEGLLSLPKGIPEGPHAKLMYLVQEISEMNNEITLCLHKGKSSLEENNLFLKWRDAFVKMKKVFDSMRDGAMEDKFQLEVLKLEILKKRGNELSGFLNFELFENFITKHVELYKVESETLLQEIFKCTDELITGIINKYFMHLPDVNADLKQISFTELERQNGKTIQRLNFIFEQEKLVFTCDEVEFEQELEKIKKEEKIKEEKNETPHNTHNGIFNGTIIKEDYLEKNTKRLRNLIECYLKTVHFRLSDTIPMAIRQSLHIELCKRLKGRFIEYATKSGVDLKIKETRSLNEERVKLTDRIERLQKARMELAKL